LVTKAEEAIGEVAEAARSVTQIMHEISAASEEQSNGITQVNQAVAEMDQATQRNALRVQETARAAVSLEKQAGLLALSVEAFRLNSNGALRPPALTATKHVAQTPNALAAQPPSATSPHSPVKRQAASVEEWEAF